MVYIINFRPVYPISSQLSTEIVFQLFYCKSFLKDLFSQAEESTQARAGPSVNTDLLSKYIFLRCSFPIAGDEILPEICQVCQG